MVKYVNSKNEEIELTGSYLRLKETSFADYEWNYELVARKVGAMVSRFSKKEKVYGLNLTVPGNEQQKREKLERFYRVTEYDVVSKTPGRLYVNDEYINCFVFASITMPKRFYCEKEIKVLCPYPFWISEKKLSFGKYNGSGSNNFLNYPYNYPYNYTGINKGFSQINNEHYYSVHFRMTIYGPCVNPMIIIGGHTYIVNTIVGENEYLEIDSRNRTVIKTLIDGTKVNEFNNRGFESETFKKIPPGVSPVNWSGEYGFDIVLFCERSEPKWTQK